MLVCHTTAMVIFCHETKFMLSAGKCFSDGALGGSAPALFNKNKMKCRHCKTSSNTGTVYDGSMAEQRGKASDGTHFL